jgi:hypothetical protein
MWDFIMSVNCYNGRFIITAKSLETNVAVVTRVDCTFIKLLFSKYWNTEKNIENNRQIYGQPWCLGYLVVFGRAHEARKGPSGTEITPKYVWIFLRQLYISAKFGSPIQ